LQDLPQTIDQVDKTFMTRVLRHAGVIATDNEVVMQEETDVGMTAGYFSAIKKVRCTYRDATGAPSAFVVKTWPSFEILPKEAIAAMFAKDVAAYSFADVQRIVAERCAPCHAAKPTQAGFNEAPKGVLLDTPALIVANAQKINEQAVLTKAMPIGNLTGMTDAERATLGAWIAAGAPAK